MTQTEMEKEERSLRGEIAMGVKMLEGHRMKMAEMLNGEMGADMVDVLDGKKKVDFTWWYKLIIWFKFKLAKLINRKNGRIQTGYDEYS